MICPQCHAEYREGFATCADCQVPLVLALRAEGPDSGVSPKPGDPSLDPFCAFWQGDDSRVHAELCTILDEVGIPHTTVRRGDYLFNTVSRPTIQIGVPASLYEKAEQAVHDAFGANDEAQRILRPPQSTPDFKALMKLSLREKLEQRRDIDYPASEESISGDLSDHELLDETLITSVPSPIDSEDWYPEDATREIWSGDDPERAEFISTSLQANGIHARIESVLGLMRIFVMRQDEASAREVVQQILHEDAEPG